MTKTVVIVGALDTKEDDFVFVQKLIRGRGLKTLLVDFGVLGSPTSAPDITNAEVAQAGGSSIEKLRAEKDKAEAMRVMSTGLRSIVSGLYRENRLGAIFGMGGTGGTAIAAAAMRDLPIGVPKLIVSTAGSGDMSAYVGLRDILVMPSVVDVAGVNRISRLIYSNAVGAITGMVQSGAAVTASEKPLIAASMFGNTTVCVNRARATLEDRGYEVLVFHATGSGGKTMQSLVEEDYIIAVLDLTTTELADEVCGGIFSAGIERIRIGAANKVPVVLAPGCVDMCNFAGIGTVPVKYQGRQLYEWNSNITLMRTNIEENIKIGEMLAATANNCAGPVTIILPLRGVSMLDSLNNPFWNPDADRACFNAIKRNVRGDIPLIEVDANINDPSFADRSTELLLAMLDNQSEEI